MRQIRKILNLFVIFAYFNALLAPVYANEPGEHSDYVIKIKKTVQTTSKKKYSKDAEGLHLEVQKRNERASSTDKAFTTSFNQFIPLTAPFTKKQKSYLTEVHDTQKRSLGFNWSIPHLLSLFVSWDGSVLLNKVSSSRSLSIQSSGMVSVENATFKKLSLQARSILLGNDVDVDELELQAHNESHPEKSCILIPEKSHLSLRQAHIRQGSLFNYGTIVGENQTRLSFYGNDFYNYGTFKAAKELTLYQLGYGQNNGTIESTTVRITGYHFENNKTIRGRFIHSFTYQEFDNKGTIEAEDEVTLFSFGSLSNSGTFLSQNTQRLMARGTLDNKGTIKAPHNFMHANNLLVNEGEISGDHQQIQAKEIQQKGAINSKTLTLKVDEGSIAGTVKGQESTHLVIGKHVVIEKKTRLEMPHLMISGTGRLENHAGSTDKAKFKITGTLEFLQFAGELVNRGVIEAGKGIKGFCQSLANQGIIKTLHGFSLSLQTLFNDPKARLEGSGTITLANGQNKGFLGNEDLTLHVGGDTFENTGTVRVNHLTGSGHFWNAGLLFGNGTEKNPAILSIESFQNKSQEGSSASAKVIGKYMTITEAVRNWQNEGLIDIQHLTLERTAKDSFFSNKGEIRSQYFLALHEVFKKGRTTSDKQTIFNEGTMLVDFLDLKGIAFHNKDSSSLKVHQDASLIESTIHNKNEFAVSGTLKGKATFLHNEGILFAKGKTKLEGSELINDGKASFEERAVLERIHNRKTLRALKGLSLSSEWQNSGTAEIHKGLTLKGFAFNNSGLLILLHANLRVASWSVRNDGEIRFIHSSPAWHLNTLENRGTLRIEGDEFFVESLINHGKTSFKPGAYTLANLENYKDLVLEGEGGWNIYESRPEDEENDPKDATLIVKSLYNDKHIIAEGSLGFDHSAKTGKITSGGSITLTKKDEGLKPQDLKEINARDSLRIEAKSFTVDQPTILDIPLLVLRLEDNFFVKSDFKVFGGLDALVNGLLMVGESNDHMARLVTEGSLELLAKSIDARFGKIYGKGRTKITAYDKDVTVGSFTETSAYALWNQVLPQIGLYNCQTAWHALVRRGGQSLFKRTSNGAYISSGDDLELRSYTGDIVLDHSDVHAEKSLTLKTHAEKGSIQNTSGSLHSKEDLTLYGREYKGVRPAPGYVSSVGYVETGDPSRASSLKTIHMNTGSVRLVNSDLLAGESIYSGNRIVAKKGMRYDGSFACITEPRSEFPASSQKFGQFYYSPSYSYMNDPGSVLRSFTPSSACHVNAGGEINVIAKDFTFSSVTNALAIHLKGETLTAECPLLHRENPRILESNLIIDLGEVGQRTYQHRGFIRQLEDGRIGSDVALSSSLVPTHDQLLFLQESEALIPSSRQFFIDPSVLEFVIQQALSQHVGTLNLEGLSGNALVRHFFHNAATYRHDTERAVVTQEEAEKSKKALLFFKARQIVNQVLWSAQLSIPPQMVNPYNQSGDTSSDIIDMQTTGDQTHKNNRVVATQHLQALAGGTLTRETEKYSRTYHQDDTTTVVEYARPQQTFECLEGDVITIGTTGYNETGARTRAGRTVVRKATQGPTIVQPLTLATTVITRKKDSGFMGVGRKEKVEVTTSHVHQVSECTTALDSFIGDRRQRTNLTASQERAGRDLYISGEETTVSAHITKRISQSRETARNPLATTTMEQTSESPEVTKALLTGGRSVHFPGGKATVTGTNLAGSTLHNETEKGLAIGPDVAVMQQTSTSTKKGAVSDLRTQTTRGQEVLVDSRLNVETIETTASSLSLTNILLDPDTVINGAYSQTTRTPRSWQTTITEGYDYTSEVAALAALATCVLTSGWGLGWGTSLASALNVTNAMGAAALSVGVSSVISQAASGLILRDGNIEAVGRDLVSSSSLRSLVTSMAGAALVQGLGDAFKLPLGLGQARTLPQHLQINLLRSAVNSGLSMAVEGTDPGVALRQGVRSVVANTLGGLGSNHIGSAYHDGVLDYITHKVLHAVLGAATGAILNEDTLRGALSGAVGAVTAEVVADMLKQNAQEMTDQILTKAEQKGRLLSPEEFKDAYNEELKKKADLARLAAGAMAFGIGEDIHTATATATNAVENNFLPAALIVAGVAWTAYDAYIAYRDEGPEAALMVLARDGIITVAGGVVGKGVVKIGKIAYPSAKVAWAALVKEMPILNQIATKVSALAAKVQDKVVNSRLGQVASKAKEKLNPSKKKESVWGPDSIERGNQIEEILGRNLHKNFPVIDRFEFKKGLITSIKSVDLNAKTYKNSSILKTKLESYVDKVADFKGKVFGGTKIYASQIKERALEVAIPHAGTTEQKTVIQKLIEYGKAKGVKVNPKVIE
jgi:hypothetical protein